MIRFFYSWIIVSIYLTIQVEGACFLDPFKSTPPSNVPGSAPSEQYCEYKGENRTIGTRWSLPYPDCLNCDCLSIGLSCCGYGVRAGVVGLPDDCKLAEGTCELKPVKISDPSKSCFDPPSTTTTTTASTKKRCAGKRKKQP